MYTFAVFQAVKAVKTRFKKIGQPLLAMTAAGKNDAVCYVFFSRLLIRGELIVILA